MAACTSRAAASMLRFRSNCIAMAVDPNWLDEVIWLIAAMRPNWRSSGVATADAMVSGLAPGNCAPTEITGKSTCGSGDTGNCVYASPPASSSAIVASVVAMGRWIAGPETFMLVSHCLGRLTRAHVAERRAQSVEPQVHHRRRVQRQQLAEQQAAHDGDAKRPPQFRASC